MSRPGPARGEVLQPGPLFVTPHRVLSMQQGLACAVHPRGSRTPPPSSLLRGDCLRLSTQALPGPARIATADAAGGGSDARGAWHLEIAELQRQSIAVPASPMVPATTPPTPPPAAKIVRPIDAFEWKSEVSELRKLNPQMHTMTGESKSDAAEKHGEAAAAHLHAEMVQLKRQVTSIQEGTFEAFRGSLQLDIAELKVQMKQLQDTVETDVLEAFKRITQRVQESVSTAVLLTEKQVEQNAISSQLEASIAIVAEHCSQSCSAVDCELQRILTCCEKDRVRSELFEQRLAELDRASVGDPAKPGLCQPSHLASPDTAVPSSGDRSSASSSSECAEADSGGPGTVIPPLQLAEMKLLDEAQQVAAQQVEAVRTHLEASVFGRFSELQQQVVSHAEGIQELQRELRDGLAERPAYVKLLEARVNTLTAQVAGLKSEASARGTLTEPAAGVRGPFAEAVAASVARTATTSEPKLRELRRALKVASERRLREVFDQCDEDGDGAVSKEEMAKALRRHPEVAKFFRVPSSQGGSGDSSGDGDHIDALFAAVDADGNGEISWQELLTYFKPNGDHTGDDSL